MQNHANIMVDVFQHFSQCSLAWLDSSDANMDGLLLLLCALRQHFKTSSYSYKLRRHCQQQLYAYPSSTATHYTFLCTAELAKNLKNFYLYGNPPLKDGQHGQILNEISNKAKINKEIEILETINIELKHSVAKLRAENEKLHKENEHSKQTYKDLYDSIKKTRVQTKDHNDSLIAQINSKTFENDDLKAQIQEKVFANVALKNEIRKLKGNSVDTKFAKPSILGKPILQPPRNQLVVRQPNAFKSKRPNFSKPRFASQVDVNIVLSNPITP
ncbi:hypothetical protein Tco_1203672 [Tanacetum coccineum]